MFCILRIGIICQKVNVAVADIVTHHMMCVGVALTPGMSPCVTCYTARSRDIAPIAPEAADLNTQIIVRHC